MDHQELPDRVRRLEIDQATHTAVCEERYKTLSRDINGLGGALRTEINKITRLLIKVAILIGTGMGGILAKMLFFTHGGG